MPPTTAQFKAELGRLPIQTRAELAHFLIESLDGEPDDDWEAAWEVELDRRMAEIENGTVVGIQAEEVSPHCEPSIRETRPLSPRSPQRNK